MFKKILLFILIFTSASAWALKSSEVIVEAQSAFQRGDMYNAYRYYSLAIDKTPDALYAKDVENFVLANSILQNSKDFLKMCQDMSAKGQLKIEFSFYCAKTLIHNEKYLEATNFIDLVPPNYQRLEYDLVKASMLLGLNKASACIDQLKTSDKKITPNTSLHFRDLLKVLQARCFLAESRYDLAISKFQSLTVNSDFYLSTLEEQAWAQFKARNLIAARGILKILISYFTGVSEKNQIFGADLYFRSKYLQAYIELISQDREKARDLFTQLRNEIKDFKKSYFKKIVINKNLPENLRKITSTGQLLNNNFSQVTQFRIFLTHWASGNDLKKFDNNLREIISLNQEIETLSLLKSDGLGNYQQNVLKLRNAEVAQFVQKLRTYFSASKHSIDSIEFKTNMGQVENFWADRTEGKRTLAEALEEYKNQINYVEDRIEK